MFILEPKSVALIGASAEEKKLGYSVLQNLLSGYKGKIYPVNPKHDEVLGKKCFKSIKDTPGVVDMAVIVTPAATVLDVLEECGKKKVKTVVVISAGFAETGTEEGTAREMELKAIGKKYGMAIVGPNCLGVLRPRIGLNASFAESGGEPGHIALISQSGALAVAVLDMAPALQLRFSSVISIGNKADLTESDYLEILAEDPETTVIGLYLESVADGERFAEIAARVTPKKPIVLTKSGVSVRGRNAVSSHTGALAGSTAALVAACERAGIQRAASMDEFLELLQVRSSSPPLLSPGIAIITNAGGPGVLATDAAEQSGLELVTLSPKTSERLRSTLPLAASIRNPVDILGDALGDRYAEAIAACAKDPKVDGLAILLTPQVMTPALEVAKMIVKTHEKCPMIPIVTSFMGGTHTEKAKQYLREHGVSSFDTPEKAVQALANLRQKKPAGKIHPEDPRADDRSSAGSQVLKGQRGALPVALVEDLFLVFEIPIPSQALASTAEEAAEIAEQIGYPVICKISSPDILHKTDVGGVRTNVKSAKEVKAAFKEILDSSKKLIPAAAIEGVLIQQFLPAGSEFIVGGLQDPSFGPLVMVGLGGIYTELFHDTCFRLAPVSSEEAFEMLSKLKSWKLLTGMRGKKALNIEALASLIERVSELLSSCPTITELDLNPVLVTEKGIIVTDAKVIIGEGRKV